MGTYCCEHARRAQWRPITDIHEDYGPVVVIDITDPGSVAVVWETGDVDDTWTHFAELPQLTSEQADELEKEMRK